VPISRVDTTFVFFFFFFFFFCSFWSSWERWVLSEKDTIKEKTCFNFMLLIIFLLIMYLLGKNGHLYYIDLLSNIASTIYAYGM